MHLHIDKLSYTLKNTSKELRYLAVQHVMGLESRTHPQYTALKENFEKQKPQIVLYEGPQGNPQSMTEEDAYTYGEKAYMQYLVLEHNKNLKPSEVPTVMKSCDLQPQDAPAEFRKRGYTNEEITAREILKWMYYEADALNKMPGLTDEQRAQRIQELQAKYEGDPIAPIKPDFFSLVPRADGQQWTAELVKTEIQKQTGQALQVDFDYLSVPRFRQMFDNEQEFRDKHIVRKIAEATQQYDRVMAVMGSSHAIRDKQALEQYFDTKEKLPEASQAKNQVIGERTSYSDQNSPPPGIDPELVKRQQEAVDANYTEMLKIAGLRYEKALRDIEGIPGAKVWRHEVPNTHGEGMVPAVSTWVPEKYAELWELRVEGKSDTKIQKGLLAETQITPETNRTEQTTT